MKVDEQMTTSGNVDFFNPSFRYTLESHLPYLLGLTTTRAVSVDPHDAIVYNQDLYGYLLSISVLPCYHWVIMRLNGFFTPAEFDSTVVTILIPNFNELESLRQSWNATTTIGS